MPKRHNVVAPKHSTDETRERRARNTKAFIDVLGDPTATPEPIDGWYQRFKSRSSIAAVQNNFDEGHSTRNPARPTPLDFFCDVENAIKSSLVGIISLKKFWEFYTIGNTESLSRSQRSRIEQRLGQRFRAQRISPVSKYFTTIRRPVGDHR